MTAKIDDEEFVRLWHSDETQAEISARLGIGHDELISAWKRLGLIAPMKGTKADDYDGRASVGDDLLLARLRSGLR